MCNFGFEPHAEVNETWVKTLPFMDQASWFPVKGDQALTGFVSYDHPNASSIVKSVEERGLEVSVYYKANKVMPCPGSNGATSEEEVCTL